MNVVLFSDIPKKEKEQFMKFYNMYSKMMLFQNLSKKDIEYYRKELKRVLDLLEKGLYDKAREEMGLCIMKLLTKRAISGFGIQYEMK